MTKMSNTNLPSAEGASGSSGSATELSSLLPPSAMPLLAAFLATRREVATGSICGPPAMASDPLEARLNTADLRTTVRSRHRRLKRSSRTHR